MTKKKQNANTLNPSAPKPEKKNKQKVIPWPLDLTSKNIQTPHWERNLALG